ncbi:MAG: DUF3394 domain-containing protein, partial [Rhodospirillales bacterium]|nr:DUF3394 domain-containing protein [Rhodospirillales bacterium]
TGLLLIDVDLVQGIFVFIVATAATLLFAAATQGFFLARSRTYESVLLLLVAFSLFRPGFWMERNWRRPQPDTPAGGDLWLTVAGLNDVGDPITFVALLPIGDEAGGAERLKAAGLTLINGSDGKVTIDDVGFDSPASRAGLDWDAAASQVPYLHSGHRGPDHGGGGAAPPGA